jgi:anti-sigma-K factor RskA
MSGTAPPPDDRAGLYVLGALNAEEMRAVRLAAGRDEVLAAEILDWERRLAPLTQLVDPIAPPPALWTGLESRLSRGAGAPDPVADIARPTTPSRRRAAAAAGSPVVWRGLALGAMALAAGLAVALVIRPPSAPLGQLAVLLPARPGAAGWLLQVLPNGDISATAPRAVLRAPDQDYQLWALPENAEKPLPLGLLPVTGQAVLKTAGLPKGRFQFLVSLEQKGGSPTGLPTLPVLFQGEPLARPASAR